jgi:hypothetical protein
MQVATWRRHCQRVTFAYSTLEPRDRAHLGQPLPWQPDHQPVEPRLRQRNRLRRVELTWLREATDIQASRGTPHAEAIVHRHLDAHGPRVCKHVAVVGVVRAPSACTTCASSRPALQRKSTGFVDSHGASMRIIAVLREATLRSP